MLRLVDFKEVEEKISNTLRLKTRPVGVKFVKSAEDFPEGTMQPTKNFGIRVATCQAIALSRRYGWIMGLTNEDIKCVPSSLMYGLVEITDPAAVLEAMKAMGYGEDEKAIEKMVVKFPLLPFGENEGMYSAPLGMFQSTPDIVHIYCDPSQAWRLVQAAIYKKIEVTSTYLGVAESCRAGVEVYKNKTTGIYLPGGGDRVFAMAADDELIWATTFEDLQKITEIIEVPGQQVGLQYPVPTYLLFEPFAVPAWTILEEKIKKT